MSAFVVAVLEAGDGEQDRPAVAADHDLYRRSLGV
jgi:hypothetical protein